MAVQSICRREAGELEEGPSPECRQIGTAPADKKTVAAFARFDRDGRHAETVALPFRVDAWIPLVVHGDAVWAVVTDESDVQYVVRARLRPVARSDV